MNFIDNGSDRQTTQYIEKSISSEEFERNRVIKLSGSPETLDKIEQMLAYMQWLGSVGHSTSFTVGVDGDGGFSCKITTEHGKELSKKYDKDLGEMMNENHDIKSFDFY